MNLYNNPTDSITKQYIADSDAIGPGSCWLKFVNNLDKDHN